MSLVYYVARTSVYYTGLSNIYSLFGTDGDMCTVQAIMALNWLARVCKATQSDGLARYADLDRRCVRLKIASYTAQSPMSSRGLPTLCICRTSDGG
jgi:hypothetical protein